MHMPGVNVDRISVDDAMKEHARLVLLGQGDWSYGSGTGSGSDNRAGRIVGITVFAPPGTAATFSIGANSAITVPAGGVFNFEPRGLTNAQVDFTGTESWVVERVAN